MDLDKAKAAIGKTISKKWCIIFPVIAVVLVLMICVKYLIGMEITAKDADNPNSTPGQAQGYTNSLTLNNSGQIESGETVEDVWDEMIEAGRNDPDGFIISDYLKDSKELAKLINAEIVTQNLDMRTAEQKKKEIDWNKALDPTSKKVQGIIKLKRSDKDENIIDLTYMEPVEFNAYVKEYESGGNQEARDTAQNTLKKHFTIGKKYIMEEKEDKEESKKEDNSDKYSWPSSFEKIKESFDKNKEGIKIEVLGESTVNAWDEGTVTDKTDKKIVIKHSDKYISEYHNVDANVKKNDKVEKGQIIGKVKGKANSEKLTYLEIKIKKDKKYVNPNMFNYIDKEKTDTLCWPLPESLSSDKYGITSTFGNRPSMQTDNGSWTNDFHGGLDMCAGGSPEIVAAEDGIVETASFSDSWGNNVYIKHNETYNTRYAHLEKCLVNPGDHVVKGQTIGIMGATGQVTGAHLHFEVYEKGKRIDPFWFNYVGLNGEEIILKEGYRNPDITLPEEVIIGAKVGFGNFGQVVGTKMELTAKVASFSSETEKNKVEKTVKEDGKEGGKELIKDVTTGKYTVDIKEIPYQEMVKPYAMPFEYLWSWLIAGGDKDFVLELADLVYNSEFEITVYDDYNQTIVKTVTEKREKTNEDKTAERSYNLRATPEDKEKKEEIIYKSEPIKVSYSYEQDIHTVETNTKTNTYNNATCVLSKVDSWLVKMIQEVKHNDQETDGPKVVGLTEKPDEIKKLINTTQWPVNENSDPFLIKLQYSFMEYIESNKKELNEAKKSMEKKGKYEYTYDFEKKYSHTETFKIYDQKTTIYNTTTKSKYVLSPKEVKEKTTKKPAKGTNNFVSIYNKDDNRELRSSIKDVGMDNWLFNYLEQNEETADMVDLTKYLLYKATGESYGITELDLSIYEKADFDNVSTVSTMNQLIKFIHDFEVGPISPAMNAQKTEYVIINDGVDNPTVGYGVLIYNNKGQKGAYTDLFLDAGYKEEYLKNMDGTSTLPIELVDKISSKILDNTIKNVNKQISTYNLELTGYQKNALYSMAYNFDSTVPDFDEFAQLYKKHWSVKKDDKYEDKEKKADLNHKLYTEFFARYCHANSQVLDGLVRRRKAEWTLFQTGYYGDYDGSLNFWHTSASDLMSVAAEYDKKLSDEKWVYSRDDYRYVIGGDIEASTNHHMKETCCATFVNSILYLAGYVPENIMNTFSYNGSTSTHDFYLKKGWDEVALKDIQPGDLVFYQNGAEYPYGHIEIYAGDGMTYSAGGTEDIMTKGPDNPVRTPNAIIRPEIMQ